MGQFKMIATDGKMRETYCLSTENILRLIQSILSPKAEPFKIWFVKVGNEKIDELADPQKAIDRALETYLKKRCFKDSDILSELTHFYLLIVTAQLIRHIILSFPRCQLILR